MKMTMQGIEPRDEYQGAHYSLSRLVAAILTVGIAMAGCAHVPTAPLDDLNWSQLPPIPDPLGVGGAFAGVSNDAILVAGGANFPDGMPWDGGKKAWLDTVHVLERPDGHWKTAGKLPRPLAYGVSIQTPDGVLCVGGNDADRLYADAFVLTWEDGQLRTRAMPPLPLPVINACGARVGSLAIVAGGEASPGAVEAVSHCWALDLNAVERGWQALPAWPGEGRTLAVAASLKGGFYIVGGAALYAGPDGGPLRRYLLDGYAFHPGKGTWRRIADMPHPYAAAPTPALVIGPARFAIAGGDDSSKYLFKPQQRHPGFCDDVLAYDAHADAWSVIGHVPAPRATVSTVSWRGYAVFPSGEMRPGVRSPEVWAWRTGAQGG